MNGMYDYVPENCDNQKRQSIEAVISAYKSILSPLAHVSMPITTGETYYALIDKLGHEPTQQQLYTEVIRPNAERGIAFAKQIEPLAKYPLVVPGLFEAKELRWEDDEYMYMWYSVIQEKVLEIWMIPGWQYSSGCCEEFIKAVEMQEKGSEIKIRNYFGEEIAPSQGAILVNGALTDLSKRGYDRPRLESCYQYLLKVSKDGRYTSSSQ